jgi:mitogen-activated protein kinase 1/3
LNRTIVFNPRKRLKVDEALNHPLFSKVRDKKKEIIADGPIVLDFEKEGDLDADRLRELFVREIKFYHKK